LYVEESELQFRIKKSGYNIKLIPDAKIMHYAGGSTSGKAKKLKIEKLMLEGNIKFFKVCYGIDSAKKARVYYIIYYLRYLVFRFFTPKAFARLKMAMELKI
jgi:GT2 family glycosyltransferase